MTRPTFFGCSVRQLNAQAGWGMTGLSQLTTSVVVDPTNGDVFQTPIVGAPAFFQYGNFSFGGLVKAYNQSGGVDGLPTYDIVVTDPREVLAGTQVILGGYTGSTLSVVNVLNVFGWWESQGFGLAQSDESGMPWAKIAAALTALLGQPLQTNFGGPLQYRGYTYGIDLSEVPTPPADYRIGATLSISLLELIAMICEDGGYDFLVDLVGSIVRVRTISRRTAPPLGTLQAIIQARQGIDLIRYQTGVESRTEPTSVILFGAEKRQLHESFAPRQFWGYDTAGQPILGTSGRLDLVDKRYVAKTVFNYTAADTAMELDIAANVPTNQQFPWATLKAPFEILVNTTAPLLQVPPGVGYADTSEYEVLRANTSSLFVDGQRMSIGSPLNPLLRGRYSSTPVNIMPQHRLYLSYGSVLCEFMQLNSSPIADIIGSVTYATNTFELRLAKGNFNAWAVYLAHYREDIAERVGILSPFRNKKGGGDKLPPDLIDDSSDAALKAMAALNADAQAKIMRFYEWIRGYADEYMGRKFLVPLPAVSFTRDSETLRVRSSYEIDEGGWLDEGLTPLSLPSLHQDAFKTQDGRFRTMVRYQNVATADFSAVSPDNTLIDTTGAYFWSLADADPNLVLSGTDAYALVTVPGPLTDTVIDSLGDLSLVKATLQLTPGDADKIFAKAAFGNLGIKVAPASRLPDAAVVPLKSNTETYGPWLAAGVPGPARVDYDQGLAPWHFGSSTLMERAGQARVNFAIMNALAIETGTLEFAGAPTSSLGDTLADGGPPVTGVQMSYGQAITTTYQFQTFTPRFGIFARNNAERLKRISLAQAQLRRAVRLGVKGALAQGVQSAVAGRINRAFHEDVPKVLQRQSPHEMLVAESYQDTTLNRVRTGVSSLTLEETIGAISADDASGYRSHAAMSWTGLLRPFSTQIPAASLAPPSGMPQYHNLPNWASGGIGRDTLDPWKSVNDLEAYAWGSSYNGVTGSGKVPTDARVLAQRGPVVVAGFGYDTEGYPVPGNGSGQFNTGHLTQPETWKVGPVDSLWDERRGVWTSHDVLKGKVKTTISSNLGSGLVQVWHQGSGIPWDVAAYNWSGTALSSGTSVHLLFNVLDRRWYAQSVDASGTSSSSSVVGGVNEVFFGNPAGTVGSPTTSPGLRYNWNGDGSLKILASGGSSLNDATSHVGRLDFIRMRDNNTFAVPGDILGGVAFYSTWANGGGTKAAEIVGIATASGTAAGKIELRASEVLALTVQQNAVIASQPIYAGSTVYGGSPGGSYGSMSFGVGSFTGPTTSWSPNGGSTAYYGLSTNGDGLLNFTVTGMDGGGVDPHTHTRLVIRSNATYYYGASGINLTGDLFYGGINYYLETDPTVGRTRLGLGSMATEDAGNYLTGNESITFTATGDVTGTDTGATSLNPTLTIADDAVTYAKMQNVSDTDKVLGRSSSGAGDVEEIPCTSTGRSVLAAANAAAVRSAAGCGTAAEEDIGTGGATVGLLNGDWTQSGDNTWSGMNSFGSTTTEFGTGGAGGGGNTYLQITRSANTYGHVYLETFLGGVSNTALKLNPTYGGNVIVGAGASPAGGGQCLVLSEASSQPSSLGANTAVLYSQDDGLGTCRAYAMAEDGTNNLLAQHAMDCKVSGFYDLSDPMIPYVLKDGNNHLGVERWINVSRMGSIVERLAAILLPDVPEVERRVMHYEGTAREDWDERQRLLVVENCRQIAARKAQDAQFEAAIRAWLKLPTSIRLRTPKPRQATKKEIVRYVPKPIPVYIQERL